MAITLSILCNKRQSIVSAMSKQFFSTYLDGERSGRPRTASGIIDPLIDEIIELDPRELGYRSTVWVATLLVHYLWDFHQISVSRQSVSMAIERLHIRWKRPRHHLSLRPEAWRQAKGG